MLERIHLSWSLFLFADKESYLLSVTYLVTVVNVHFRIEESLPDAFDRCNAIGRLIGIRFYDPSVMTRFDL